jgi:FSR family fosmidomycin resistance protein-like MFS transporter
MIADLNAGAIPAILPFLKESLGLTYAMAGTILLCSNLTSSVIQPVFGYFSDRRSLTWFLPLGCFVAGLGIAFIAWADTYWQITSLVILSGLGVAIYHPVSWRVANYFSGAKKATGMSIFNVGGNLGVAIGPLLAIFSVKHFGLRGMMIFAFPGAVMACIFLATRFWRVSHLRQKQAAGKGQLPSLRAAVIPMSILLATVMLRSWTSVGLIAFIPFYFISYMKGDPVRAGTLLFSFLAAGTVGTLIGGPLADRFGYKRTMFFSLSLSCPLLIFFLLSSGPWVFVWLILAGCLMIFSTSITHAMGQSFMPGNIGMASGLILGLASGMGGIGATLLGVLADHFGVPATLWVIAFMPLLSSLLTVLIPYPIKATT